MNADKYVIISPMVTPYYYGEDLLINRNKHIFLKMNSLQEQVISLADGTHKFGDIYRIILKRYQLAETENTYISFCKLIENMCRESILDLQDKEQVCLIKYAGEKGRRYPFWTLVELTDACNFKCRHCYKEASACGKYLDFGTYCTMIERLSGKTPNIVLTGGEPTIHPMINEIISETTQSFRTYLLTNASMIERIDNHLLKKLEEIQISLYGYDNEYFEWFTQSNLYLKTMHNIRSLVQENSNKVIITVILTKKNVQYIKKYIEDLASVGVKKIMFSLAIPIGRMVSERSFFSFSDNELVEVYERINVLRAEYKDQVQIAPFMDIREKRNAVLNREGFSCQAGRTNIAITEEGYVVPCHMMPRSAFAKIPFKEYIDEVEKGMVREYREAVLNIAEKLKNDNSEISEIYCNGLCSASN